MQSLQTISIQYKRTGNKQKAQGELDKEQVLWDNIEPVEGKDSQSLDFQQNKRPRIGEAEDNQYFSTSLHNFLNKRKAEHDQHKDKQTSHT
eukprot:13635985-Heterocapsa_arctica.AAC.1